MNAWKGFWAGLLMAIGCTLFLAVMISGCKTTEPTPPQAVFHVQWVINDDNGDRLYNSDCPNGCYWNSVDSSYQ